MQVLKSFCELVYDESYMDFFEDAFGYDVMQVSFHILEQNVHIFVVICSDGLVQLDDVRMV